VTGFLLMVSAVLFSCGAMGVLVRRNLLILLMCIELMLNGANLTLVVFARQWGNLEGQILAFLVIAIAAAEVGVGLGIILALFRRSDSLDVNRFSRLRW